MRPALDNFANAFVKNQKLRQVPHWLSKQQDAAWQQVQQLGLPNRKDEHWKYTSLFDIAKTAFEPAHANLSATSNEMVESEGEAIFDRQQSHTLHFINGVLQKTNGSVPLPHGVTLRTLYKEEDESVQLSQKVARESVTQALNHAFANAPIELAIKSGTKLDKPVYVRHTLMGDHILSSPRLHITLGDQVELQLVEHFDGSASTSLCNRRTSIDLGANSQLEHVTLQVADNSTSNLGHVNAKVGRDSHYASLYIDLGSQLARHDLGIELNGEGASCSMRGVFLPHAGQHFDHHTFVKHNVAHTTSQQVYHGIAGHKGHGVFNGKVLVQPQAQKINAEQSNKNILLAEFANIDTKPELEIYADDVKCSHGATVGQLDETALFYLRSRGISEQAAKMMLVRGFVSDIYQSTTPSVLLAAIANAVEQKLDKMLGELE